MLKLITAPSAEPITLAEAKLHARVEASADDTLITALITAGREEAAHTTILPVCWEQEPAVYVDSEIAWRVG